MKLPRDLSGRDLVQGLIKHWGYRQVNQVGSHIVLETTDPASQRISVPDHHPLRIGTLNAILRSIAAHKGARREDILESL